MSCLLRRTNALLVKQNEIAERSAALLADVRRLLGKFVRSENDMTRKPRRSRAQLRLIETAISQLEKDPLQNIQRTARVVYEKNCGYSSLKSFENSLRVEWNSRRNRF